MYKISVPIMNSSVKRSDRDRLLKEIKRFDAERIFLALDIGARENISGNVPSRILRHEGHFPQGEKSAFGV